MQRVQISIIIIFI